MSEHHDPDADLAVLIRATAPAPDPAFRTDLDARVAAGFPRAPGRPRRAWRRPLVWGPASALGLAAVLALVLVTRPAGEQEGTLLSRTVSAAESFDDASAGGATSGGAAAGQAAGDPAEAAKSAATAPSAANPLPPPTASAAPLTGASKRQVERGTDLMLRTPAARLQKTADAVVATTQALGGIVASSQVDLAGGAGSASFTLRVPSGRLDDAVKRLSRLGHVASLSQTAQDITALLTGATDRLDETRAERRRLLAALARAVTAEQISAARAGLADNRRVLARREASLRAQQRRATAATLTVTLEGTRARTGAGVGEEGAGPLTPRRAAGEALDVLSAVTGALILVLAALIPVAFVSTIVLTLLLVRRRRGRAAALAAAA